MRKTGVTFTKPIGLYKPRMVFGLWYIHLCDFKHRVLEIRGPFEVRFELPEQAKVVESLGYKREQ